jgi:hypothetical protein
MQLHPWLVHGDATLTAILAFFESNSDMAKLRQVTHMRGGVDAWDLDRALSPSGVLAVVSVWVFLSVEGKW